MRASASGSHWRIGLAALWLALCAGPARAGDIDIDGVQSMVINDIVHIDVDLRMRFSEDVIDALDSGIPITIAIDTEISRRRAWWLDETLPGTKQRFVISRHALSEQYLVTNSITGDRRAFLDLREATASLERLHGLPIVEARLLDGDERYTGAIRVRLDIEALPAPMRPLAYLSPAWRMSTGWYEWRLER